MRDLLIRTARMAAIAGAALFIAGCGGDSDDTANDAAGNAADSEAMLSEPGNDASAMESAAEATEPAPAANSGTDGSDSANALGDTSGGDTGGNTVESNVSGM